MFSVLSLYAKSRLVGTAAGDAATQLQWLLGTFERLKHPELWEMHLESRHLPKVLVRLLKADSNAVDVGCHIGSFLSLLLKHAPAGKHVAFEASPRKGGWLKTRFPSVDVQVRAVSDTNGVLTFQENDARPGYSRLGAAPGPGLRAIDVPVCRLDDALASRNDIGLIKFDIEGAELAALRGAEALIRRCRPAILFECGSEYFLAREKLDRRQLYDFVTDALGYRIFGLVDFLYDKGPMAFDEFRKCGLYPFRAFNFVALPPAEAVPAPSQTMSAHARG